jgi:hypothetical protein
VVGGAVRDSFPEVPVLGLYDLVGVFAVVCEVARSAQLCAGHGLHQRPFRLWIEEDRRVTSTVGPFDDRTATCADEASSILIGLTVRRPTFRSVVGSPADGDERLDTARGRII